MRAKVEEKRKLGVRMVPCEGSTFVLVLLIYDFLENIHLGSRFEAIFKQINDDGGYVEDNGYQNDVDDEEDEMITG
jgi:hypothetical protein